MGKHDQDDVRDGQWSKPVPRDDVRDTPKDDGGGEHGSSTGSGDDET